MKRFAQFIRPTADNPARNTFVADLFRILLGLLLIRQGVTFVADMAGFSASLSQTGIPIAGFVATHIIVLVHVAGGLMLTAGLFTRAAALAQVPILVGAFALVPLGQGFFVALTGPYTMAMLTLTAITFALGAGRFTVDSALFGDAPVDGYAHALGKPNA